MVNDHINSFDHLTERYGRRSDSSRAIRIAITLAVVALTAGVSWFAYQSTQEPVRASLQSWDEPAHGVLPTTIELDRADGVAVGCELVAIDLDGIVVGQLQVNIPAGPEQHLRVRGDIPLEGDGVVPQLRGCHAVPS
jgi:hypothetical protein